MSLSTAPVPVVSQHEHGRIGLARGSALYIAAVLGTGILVLPGLAAQAAGPASILAVGIVLIAAVPLAGTFAALAARYPDAGGVATFVQRAFGGTASRVVGYWFFFGVTFGVPVIAILGGEYVVAALGADRSLVGVLGITFFLVPLAVNVFGLRVSGSLQLVLTALLVAVVVGVVAASVPRIESANFTPFLPGGWAGVGVAVSLFVWAFAGWEAVTHIAGEFRDPRRTIPIATFISVAVVGAAYLALQIVTVGALGRGVPGSAVPLIDLVVLSAPQLGPALVAGITAVIATGVLNAYIPAFANLAAALAREGNLPRYFAKGAEAGAVPRRALALWSVLALGYFGIAVATGLHLEPFILIHTAAMVLLYAAGMLAALRLLRRGSGGWWFALAGALATAGLVVLAGPNLLIPAVLAVVAVAVTLVRRWRTRRATV